MRCTSARHVSRRTFMSTIRLATDWFLPIGRPNCFRSRAWRMQSSSCRRITPRQLARMQPRSHSIEHSKTSTPRPSRPSRCATGTRQSSKITSAIGDVRRPILCSLREMVRPGVSRSTMKPVMPGHAQRGIDRRVGDEQIGHRRVGDEHLRAVEHVAVAVAHRARPHAEDVGAGVGLAGRVGADAAAVAQPGQVPLALRLGAVLQDRNGVGPQMRVEREEQALVASAVAQAFHHGQQRRQAQAQPAVLFGDRHGQHAEVRALAPRVEVERLGGVCGDDVIGQRLTGKRDGRVLQPMQVLVEFHGPVHVSTRGVLKTNTGV